MASTQPTLSFCSTPSKDFNRMKYNENQDEMLHELKYQEILQIESLVKCYHFTCKIIPCQVLWRPEKEALEGIIESLIDKFVRHIVYFLRLNEDFNALSQDDQCVLLDRAAWEIFVLIKSYSCSFIKIKRGSTRIPPMMIDDAKLLLPPQMFEAYCSFMQELKFLKIDEAIVMLLIMTVLFSCDANPVKDKGKVFLFQEKYLGLLKKYTSSMFGHAAGSRVCTNMLTKVAMFRRPKNNVQNGVHEDLGKIRQEHNESGSSIS